MKILRVGTDCSGIESPIQALTQLNIKHKHIFSSDIDKYCIQSIKANYKPEIIFGDKDGKFPEGDVTKRKIKDIPDIDLYICGFPCQSFSILGKQAGFDDIRGNVFFSCFKLIKSKKPKYFILENVKGLFTHNKGTTWSVIEKTLKKLEKYGYNIKWKVLNTKDYGIPQNRERVYIVGLKNDDYFEWPEPKKLDNLKLYIDNSANHTDNMSNTVINTLEKSPRNAIFVDRGQPRSTYPNADKWTPTLTTNNHLWCVPKGRFSTHKERLMLQGFPTDFVQVVSKTQFNKQIGNSMSVNVVKAILEKLIL
jgi:DNA (cytosine-5)-methyltransferase 1